MFWLDGGQGGRATLEKSWMDGSDRGTLVVLTAQQAHSLTADTAARRLYWISDLKRVSLLNKDFGDQWRHLTQLAPSTGLCSSFCLWWDVMLINLQTLRKIFNFKGKVCKILPFSAHIIFIAALHQSASHSYQKCRRTIVPIHHTWKQGWTGILFQARHHSYNQATPSLRTQSSWQLSAKTCHHMHTCMDPHKGTYEHSIRDMFLID